MNTGNSRAFLAGATCRKTAGRALNGTHQSGPRSGKTRGSAISAGSALLNRRPPRVPGTAPNGGPADDYNQSKPHAPADCRRFETPDAGAPPRSARGGMGGQGPARRRWGKRPPAATVPDGCFARSCRTWPALQSSAPRRPIHCRTERGSPVEQGSDRPGGDSKELEHGRAPIPRVS